MTGPEMKRLAKQIADDLFTNGSNEQAQRLVLTVDKPTPRDLGGWSKAVVVYRIVRILRGAAMTGPDEIRRLIEQWRERAHAPSLESPDSELAVLRCADELEALLPSASPQAEREQEIHAVLLKYGMVARSAEDFRTCIRELSAHPPAKEG